MNRSIWISVAALAVAAAPSMGVTTIPATFTQGPNVSSGHAFVGNTFIAPAEQGLISASIMLHNDRGSDASGQLQVYSFSHSGGSGTFGTLLASTPYTVAADPTPGTPNEPAVTISGLFNVALTPGNEYAVIARWNDPTTQTAGLGSFYASDNYADGVVIFAADATTAIVNSAYDISFSATFGAIPEPTSLALLAAAGAMIRRRR